MTIGSDEHEEPGLAEKQDSTDEGNEQQVQDDTIDAEYIVDRNEELVDSFRRRATSYTSRANLSLLFIFIITIGGVLVFTYASYLNNTINIRYKDIVDRLNSQNAIISSVDSGLVQLFNSQVYKIYGGYLMQKEERKDSLLSVMATMQKNKKTANDKMNAYNKEADELRWRIDTGKDTVLEESERFKMQENALKKSMIVDSIRARASTMKDSVNAMKYDLMEIQDNISRDDIIIPLQGINKASVLLNNIAKSNNTAAAIIVDATSYKNQQFEFISTLTTRISLVFILIFLVQLLIRLYRYNIRLASYYHARADVLYSLGKIENVPFESLITLLTPDAYDIGPTPRSPIQSISDIVKTTIDTYNKQKATGG